MGVQSVIIKDETFAKEVTNEFVLNFMSAQVSAADIIRERVRYEVDKYNQKASGRFAGLIQPTDAEAELNGYKLKKPRRIDVAKQIETALKGFKSNGFFMLVDDLQVESLDEMVTLKPDMSVVFLKLTPLVGG